MKIIDRAKLIWRQGNKYATGRPLVFSDQDEMIASATDAELTALEKRIASLERHRSAGEAV